MKKDWPYSEIGLVRPNNQARLGWETRYVGGVGWYATDGVYSTESHKRISDALKEACEMQTRIDDELGIR